MNAREAAGVLAEIAMLLEIVGDNPFRARAFSSAARALEGASADLAVLSEEGRLTSLPGVGAGIAGVLAEMVESGTSSLHEELRARTPVGLYDLLKIKGLGTKRIRALYRELGVDSLHKLEEAVLAGRVAELPGFGAKTAEKILEGLAFVRATRGRRRYDQAVPVALRILEWLDALPEVLRASTAGELRRRMEVVDAIDLVAASTHPGAVLQQFREMHGLGGAGGAGEQAEVRFADGLAARLTCVPPERFAATLIRRTGSGEHVGALEARARELGLCLSDDGLARGVEPVDAPDEEALYSALGLAWIPPELREGWGEVEGAAAGTLPELVETGDLRGTFHCHTTYSDGRATVAEMAEAARSRGWSYLGIADHSPTAGYAGGLSPAAVRKQWREIDAWNREQGGEGKGRFRVFKGTESDILPDGSLDYDDSVLDGFDYVVGSVHSSFGMPEREMTARLVRAVSHPRLTVLGHPTGRLLLARTGYEVDVRAVIDAAAEHGVAIEINADPHRLDLDWRYVRYAAEQGVLVPINPDAHSVGGLGNVSWGVNVARKGWLTRREVLNARELAEVEEFFAQRK